MTVNKATRNKMYEDIDELNALYTFDSMDYESYNESFNDILRELPADLYKAAIRLKLDNV